MQGLRNEKLNCFKNRALEEELEPEETDARGKVQRIQASGPGMGEGRAEMRIEAREEINRDSDRTMKKHELMYEKSYEKV
jgi:hypothetical protein